jgi:hypothetical protein
MIPARHASPPGIAAFSAGISATNEPASIPPSMAASVMSPAASSTRMEKKLAPSTVNAPKMRVASVGPKRLRLPEIRRSVISPSLEADRSISCTSSAP